MSKGHHYHANVRWTGNRGTGTSHYRTYDRDHILTFPGKDPLLGSSDPEFRGDASRYNPEELLVSALASCHMLWYLHLCAVEGIVVEEYTDDAEGVLETIADGSGRFTAVTLHPKVRISRGSASRATQLHARAHEMCFIANSVNFSVRHEPTTEVNAPTPPNPLAPTSRGPRGQPEGLPPGGP